MEVAVTGATSSLLSKLGVLLQEEYSLQEKVRRDIKSLQNELMFMNATLRMVDEVPQEELDEQVRTWAFVLRELSYDMEDAVDTFRLRVHRNQQDTGFSTKFIRIFSKRKIHHQIADMVKDIKGLTKEVAELCERYRLSKKFDFAYSSNTRNHSSAATFVHNIAEQPLAIPQLVGTKEPVGMEAQMQRLERWLTESGKSGEGTTVLSIVGFGGMGKTTIATALYRKFQHEFECRASVTVSQNYDHEAVLSSILDQVKSQDSDHNQEGISTGKLEKKNHDALTKELRERLSGKRYLLLIDDIWSTKAWNSIRYSLPDDVEGCKIIVTTRFQAVGALCSRRYDVDLLHAVGFLSEDESKRLFYETIGKSESDRTIYKGYSCLWETCGGVPLAIVTMAGLVACNPHNSNEHWGVVRRSLFPEPMTSLTLNGVTRILHYCYKDLPADLKTCSLYLSIFPKGMKINRKRLTRRWIAEGLVSEKQGLTDEEVAETYFNHLMRRKIIRPVEHNSNGKVKTFLVHDLVHEYIVSTSREVNFNTVIGGQYLTPAPGNKVRRLSIQFRGSKDENPTEGINLSRVRSLTVFWRMGQLTFQSFNDGIIRVLDLEGCQGLKEKHMKNICNMLTLRYLSLRKTNIANVPSKIEKLENLETLDIRETNVWELPITVNQLPKISSILGGNRNRRKGWRFSQEKNRQSTKTKVAMQAVRVLSGIEIGEESPAFVASLHQLTGLRKLAIYKLRIEADSETFKEFRSAIEYLCSCGLQNLSINDTQSYFINSLDSMTLPPRYLVALELSGRLERPPMWLARLYGLNKLTLSVTVLRTETFKLLIKLDSLFSLTFSVSSSIQDHEAINIVGKLISESDFGGIQVPGGGFESLRLLRLSAPRVPKLIFSEDAMPALERIEMQFQEFEGLSDIYTLRSLQEVHLRVSAAPGESTKSILEGLKKIEKPKVIVDYVNH